MAAIAFDASSSGTTASAASLAFSHTCTGANLFLVVGVTTNNADPVSGVTYAGVAMTKLDSAVPNQTFSYWYLVNPSTGANNVVVSVSPNSVIDAVSASYTGVKQSAPEANNKSTPSTSPVSVSVTTITNNAWTVAVFTAANGGAVFTVTSSGDTKRVEKNTNWDIAIIDSNSAISPAGSDTTSATFTLGGNGAGIVAALAPVVDGGGLDLTPKFW